MARIDVDDDLRDQMDKFAEKYRIPSKRLMYNDAIYSWLSKMRRSQKARSEFNMRYAAHLQKMSKSRLVDSTLSVHDSTFPWSKRVKQKVKPS